jgi:hypothetical protein
MAHIRQSSPDSSLGFEVTVLKMSLLGSFHTLSHSLSLSLSLPRTHTLSHTVSLAHTLVHSSSLSPLSRTRTHKPWCPPPPPPSPPFYDELAEEGGL